MPSCIIKVSDKFYGILKLSSEEEKKKATEDISKPLKTFEDSVQGKFFGGIKWQCKYNLIN